MIIFVIPRHEGEMYKTLLSDYDTRQRELLLENAELKIVLQQMKKDIVSILSSRKPTLKDDKHPDDGVQVGQVVFLYSLMLLFNCGADKNVISGSNGWDGSARILTVNTYLK